MGFITPSLAALQDLAKSCDYKVTTIAYACGVSTRTLERFIMKITGQVPRRWLKAIRLELARQKLQTGTPMKEVAFDLGFKQVSHFSREYKRHFGHSPRVHHECLILLSPSDKKSRV
jgi:transcriptional regulator GlxA family with amidase domain